MGGWGTEAPLPALSFILSSLRCSFTKCVRASLPTAQGCRGEQPVRGSLTHLAGEEQEPRALEGRTVVAVTTAGPAMQGSLPASARC